MLMLGVAAHAHAQSVYVNGGMALTWRQAGWRGQTPTDVKPGPEPVTTLSVGGGWWLNGTVAVEGSIEFLRAQSLSWRYTYFANRHMSTTDRDTPILGHVRFRAAQLHRISIEPVLGGGVTRHAAQSFVLEECATPGSPTCTTVTPPRPSPEDASWEWSVSGAMDVPIWLSTNVAVAPTARLLFVNRRQYLTSDGFRGPDSGHGLMPSVGLQLRWTHR